MLAGVRRHPQVHHGGRIADSETGPDHRPVSHGMAYRALKITPVTPAHRGKENKKMTNVYEQKLNGRIAERLTVSHGSGIATLERIDDQGKVTSKETFSAGDGKVSQFVYAAEPK